MVGKIGDSGDSSGITPADKKMYKKEFEEAANLFEDALNSDTKSNYVFQKDEYRKVMEKSVDILKETADALNQKGLIDQANKLEKDLAAYEKDGGSQASIFQLHQDLEKAKKSVK